MTDLVQKIREKYPSIVSGKKGFQSIPLEKRFWEKVQRSDGCWIWTAHVGFDGYGRIGVGRSCRKAPRVCWQICFGEIPVGVYVLHTCDNKLCVRPDHLYLGNNSDNMKDRSARGRTNNFLGRQTHCKLGHEFSGSNLSVRYKPSENRTYRECVECRRRKNVRWRERDRVQGEKETP